MPRRWPRCAVLWVATMVIGGLMADPCAAQNLIAIPTESPPSAMVPDEAPLRVVLHVRDPGALAQVLGLPVPAPGTDVLLYDLNGYQPLGGADPRRVVEPSFVIDYNEPSVSRLQAEFAASQYRIGRSDVPTLDSLISFVADSVHASYDRGFEIASEAAEHREGDCKVYAVLTTALARAAGIPARVVFGLVLLRSQSTYRALGHAWAELEIDGHWIAADAALAHASLPVRYLPLGVLADESMGFARDFLRLTPVWVQRIDVLGAPEPKHR